MIASMYLLDHRLAELRQTSDDIRREQLARDARGSIRGGAIVSFRSLFGRRPATDRSASVAV